MDFLITPRSFFLKSSERMLRNSTTNSEWKAKGWEGIAFLLARSPMVANSIAALLIHIEKITGQVPHIYFKWKEGNPVANIFRFLFLGEGDVAPIAHEVLRKLSGNLATPRLSRQLTMAAPRAIKTNYEAICGKPKEPSQATMESKDGDRFSRVKEFRSKPATQLSIVRR